MKIPPDVGKIPIRISCSAICLPFAMANGLALMAPVVCWSKVRFFAEKQYPLKDSFFKGYVKRLSSGGEKTRTRRG
jgi:hypothetical protein